MEVAAVIIPIVGVSLGLFSLVFTVHRNRHRINMELSLLELSHQGGYRPVLRVTVRNSGRTMGIEEVHFHPDKYKLSSPGFGFSVEPITWIEGDQPDLLAGQCFLSDGEVRTWTYLLNVEDYEGPLRLRVMAKLANGREVRSNFCILEIHS